MPEVANKALGSRKAWAAVIGILAAIAKDKWGLSLEATEMIVNLAMAYIVGQGVVDASARFKKESDGA